MITLPPDILLLQILPRLPEKSIHRFLCVCKEWQSFLTTPIFANMHRHHHKLLLIVLSTTTQRTFRTINCESPEDGLSTVSRPFPFDHENVSIIASVHGLVCLRIINDREYSDLTLWNPLTGEYKTLSRPDNKICYIKNAKVFGFYYSCNDYKLLLVTFHHDVYIYCLKSDSWRKVTTTQENFKVFSSNYHWVWECWKQPYVLLNERLYFLIRQINIKATNLLSFSIIRFDLKTEEWRKITSPFETDLDQSYMSWYLGFIFIRGCIHLYVKYWNINEESASRFGIEVWRMDGNEDWTKMVTYNQSTFPRLRGMC